jgi:hypothetical protein
MTMAMTKKEQAAMDELCKQLALAKALRFTDHVDKDVFPPEEFMKLSTGWVYNAHTLEVSVACSSAVSHGIGITDRTTTQRPIRMYSTKILALQALRNELEQMYATKLAYVDKCIASERGV